MLQLKTLKQMELELLPASGQNARASSGKGEAG